MNFLLAFFRLLLIFDVCNQAFAQLLDCDCSPTQYTFDVFFDRGCETQILSGIDNNAISEAGITCVADNVNLSGTGGSYGFNATISTLGPLPARSFIISGEVINVGDSTFQISFPGQFGTNGAPISKENYSSGLEIELNVFEPTDILNPVGTMNFFIPYTGLCDQVVFSDGDSIAWITYNGLLSSGPLDQTCTSSQAPSQAPTFLSSCDGKGKGKGKGNQGCEGSKKSYKSLKSTKSIKSHKSLKSVKRSKRVKSVGRSPKSTKIVSLKGKGAKRFVSPKKKKKS